MSIYHSGSGNISTQIEQNMSCGIFGVSQSVKADPVCSSLFHPSIIFFQIQTMIARLHYLSVMGKRGLPAFFSEGRIHMTGSRHKCQAGQHPAMNLRETQYMGGIIVIPPSILIFIPGQWCCTDHSKRLVTGNKEKVSPSGRLYVRVYP